MLVRQPRLHRRHARRARQHLGHLRRRDEDDVRHLPPLLALQLGCARRGRDQHARADLQRQGRGPPLPRSRQRPARRDAAGPVPHARAHPGRVQVGRACIAPPRKGDRDAKPDVANRTQGVHSFYWTIAEFVEDDLLPFAFADAEDDRQQYTMVVHNVGAALRALRRARATTAAGGSKVRRCARTTTSSTSSSTR